MHTRLTAPTFLALTALITLSPGTAQVSPPTLATARLTDLDGHMVGRVSITGRVDERLTLRLSGAAGQRGPGVRLLLSATTRSTMQGDRSAIRARHLDLGEVGKGRDTYLLPPGVRLNTFHSVVLWCASVALPMAGGRLEVTHAKSAGHLPAVSGERTQ